MSEPTLVLEIDHAQKRISRDRAFVLGQGSYEAWGGGRAEGYNLQLSSDCVRTPITYVGMLAPAPLRPQWATNGSGINLRLRKADYTLTSASWDEFTRVHSTDYWLDRKGAAEGVITTTTYPKNCPMWLGIYCYGAPGDNFRLANFGYNNSASLSGGVGFGLWADGTLEIHKNGAQIAQYEFLAADGSTKETFIGKTVGIAIIPMRGREILLWTTLGTAVLHVDADIEEGDDDPEITPGAKFWWEIPDPVQASVQSARIQFPSTGYLVSRQLALPLPIEAGAGSPTFDIRFKEPYFGGAVTVNCEIVEVDGITPFVPDGAMQACRLKSRLTGDGTNTPFLLGTLAGYDAVFDETDDSQAVDIIDHVVEASLDVPDAPSGTAISITVADQATLDVSKIETLAGRPLRAMLGDCVLMNGRTGEPHIDRGIHSEIDHLMIEVRDEWSALERYMFQDVVPLDAIPLGDAISFTAKAASLDQDLSDLDFTLPSNIGRASGEWGLMIEAGDRAAQWTTRLHEDYAGHCMMAIRPRAAGEMPVLWLKTPEDIEDQDVEITLYGTSADAADAGFTEAELRDHVWQNYSEIVLAPECNDIRVTGYDPRLQQPIQSYYFDADSKSVTLSPDARPDNWIGEPGRYALYEPGITTQAVCNEVCRRLAKRLTKIRRMAQWSGQMHLKADGTPLWRGDLIYIDQVGVFIVTSLSVQFVKEPGDDDGPDVLRSRKAIYTGEYLRESP